MSEIILSLENATIYQEKNLILNHVNFKVHQGDFIYIIGKTGSGKSSLMKTLYGDLMLKEGSGTVVGYDLTKLKQKEIPFLRRKIGIVFQDFKLLPDRSIHKNLDFVLRATGWKNQNERNEKISSVLQKVHVEYLSQKMPHQLSGGEQQRIAIARALLNDPDIILADEPTGNLDPQTSVEVMEVLKAINKQGKSIVMSTHDYALIMKFPSKTLKCEDGTLFEVVQRTV